MKRLIDWHLVAWKNQAKRKPLLLKGARQVGKTYSIRQLGKRFESFVEINFELTPEAKTIFEKDLQPERIIWELGLLARTTIIPGKTLLFLDEIQGAPQAISALRYFYELVPDLHIIAAGSLLDFAIEKLGMPVGRISMLYVYPLSFIEFLSATENSQLIEAILKTKPLSEILHNNLLDLLGHYLAIGGMPEAVQAWIETKDPRASYEAQIGLIETYRQDFPKYAKKHQIPYLEVFFNQIHHFIGKQFKYSAVLGEYTGSDSKIGLCQGGALNLCQAMPLPKQPNFKKLGDAGRLEFSGCSTQAEPIFQSRAVYKKRELAPCLNLLKNANVIHQIIHSAGHGTPLGAEVNLDRFKIISLDIGLSQALLGLDLTAWFLNPNKDLINRGPIAEAFVGQELLAYASPKSKTDLYYWKRESQSALAEVDYLYDYQNAVLPIEVKSGHGTTLRSMHRFLEEHEKSHLGMRFSAENYSTSDKIVSRPLYAVATIAHPDQAKSLENFYLNDY